MRTFLTEQGVTLSCEPQGGGPPLVLVHGAFSDHNSNWQFVLHRLVRHFTVYAVARRGRGETDVTIGHRLEHESQDIAALIRSIGSPVFLLGHSYGAHVALGAAAMMPKRVRKMILYEAPWPAILGGGVPPDLIHPAEAGDWDEFSYRFFRNVLEVPAEELDVLRASAEWAPIVADAPASLGDLRALSRYEFHPESFAHLTFPVLLQNGSESPNHLYVTDRLREVLPNAQVEILHGQAHEGMTTAPDLYADSVIRFLAGQLAVSQAS